MQRQPISLTICPIFFPFCSCLAKRCFLKQPWLVMRSSKSLTTHVHIMLTPKTLPSMVTMAPMKLMPREETCMQDALLRLEPPLRASSRHTSTRLPRTSSDHHRIFMKSSLITMVIITFITMIMILGCSTPWHIARSLRCRLITSRPCPHALRS